MKRNLITGANRGIGLELTRQLLDRGEYVYATCRHPSAAGELLKLAGSYPDHSTVIPLDITSDDSVRAAATAVKMHTQAIDRLINNAGYLHRDGSLKGFDTAIMETSYAVNAIGPMRVVYHFHETLARGNSPILANITSQLGSILSVRPHWGSYSYNGSKVALNMMTRMLALELKEAGVAVCCIHPGWVQTDMGGPSAAVTVPDSAAGILQVVDNLTLAETGTFYTYAGEIHPW